MNPEHRERVERVERVDILTQLWEGRTLLIEFQSTQDFRNFRSSLYKKLLRQDMSFKMLGIPTEDNVLYFLRLEKEEESKTTEKNIIYTVKLIPRQKYLSLQVEKTAKKYKIKEII